MQYFITELPLTNHQTPGLHKKYGTIFFADHKSRALMNKKKKTVFRIRIRIHRIHMFLGLPDPDPSIIMQK
jgi:hypothetical protein